MITNPPTSFGARVWATLLALPRVNGKVVPAQAVAAIDSALQAELALMRVAATPKRQTAPKATAKAIDEEWLDSLEQDPAFTGIDIRRELGRCQVWAGTNHVQVSRRRFTNWLLKCEKPIAVNGTGQSSFQKPVAKGMPEPPGWREWVRQNSIDPTNADKPWSSFDFPNQQYITNQLKEQYEPSAHHQR